MDLTNHLLIATPGLDDPTYEHAVIYICEHNQFGAMGVIINKPTHSRVSDILTHMEIGHHIIVHNKKVLDGGPLQTENGFVLHSPTDNWQTSLMCSDEVCLTTSQDILIAIADNDEPEMFLMTLGYCNWSSGELEDEIIENYWIVGPSSLDILFNTPHRQRYRKALSLAGIKSHNNIPQLIGHA